MKNIFQAPFFAQICKEELVWAGCWGCWTLSLASRWLMSNIWRALAISNENDLNSTLYKGFGCLQWWNMHDSCFVFHCPKAFHRDEYEATKGVGGRIQSKPRCYAFDISGGSSKQNDRMIQSIAPTRYATPVIPCQWWVPTTLKICWSYTGVRSEHTFQNLAVWRCCHWDAGTTWPGGMLQLGGFHSLPIKQKTNMAAQPIHVK